MKKMIALEIICFLLIALLLYAGVSRLLEIKTFTDDINNQPFPNQLTPLFVYGIPAWQLLTAIALMFEKTRLVGFGSALAIMLLYATYNTLILANYFGRVPCTCGGMIRHMDWRTHLIFSLFFAGISLAGILLKRKHALKKRAP